jgi:tetratricopeptide (TPR) repeat protein
MAPSEQPSQTPPETSEAPATTGIQTPPDIPPSAEAPSITLPPLSRPPVMDTAKFLRLRGWLDAALVVVVLLFAFLVASFPAGNPDFFRQLGTGRLILRGEYHFGVDPFVYTAEDTYWVNHSWLFALLMYGLYHLPAIGGAAVVIFKALLIALLAEILLRIGRRQGQSLWIPAACTALAILVLSPRLYLQSTCLSFLFLGVTLWLLTAVRQGGKRWWWLLPPLFALWVNCDEWFFLGPLAMALYLAGELLRLRLGDADAKPQAGELCMLGLVFAVSLAACLLNPHHVHALTLPPEFGLTAAGDLIEHDPQFQLRFLSPLRKDYYQPYLGLSVAGMAYWPLVLAGLTSFVFVFGRAPWWRLLVWIGFALLSLYNVRAIPFFAIVAGPITALNWLDYAAHRFGTAPRVTTGWRNWSLGVRILTVLAGLALLIATVPGWLQALPQHRRLGWSVRVDPSLEAMARTIHDWRQAGLLDGKDPHWFNMHFEVASYLAYFAPGEREFLDQGLPHFPKAAQDYLAIRQALEELPGEQSSEDGDRIALKKVRAILHNNHVRYWIFDHLSNHKADLVAQWFLFTHSEEWVLCYLKGRIAIFAWRDPEDRKTPDPSKGLALDLKRAAFGPEAEPAPPRSAEPAPPRRWWETCWEEWWRPAPPLSIDREAVTLYDFRYQATERQRQFDLHSRAWQGGVAASAIAGSLPRGPMPNSLLALSWCCTYNDLFPPGAVQPARQPRQSEQLAMLVWDAYLNRQFFEAPSLYLGIRAARRALFVDPEDGLTYFRLGQAYQQRSRDLPQESKLLATVPRLAAIRRTQMVAAFQNCLRLQLDDDKAAQAHVALFKVFDQLKYLDAAVHHRREALNKWTAAEPPPGISPTEYNQKLDQMSAELTRLEGELERRLERYEVNAAPKSGLEKVKVALDLGLTETALSELQQVAQEKIDTFNQNDRIIIKRVTGVALDLGRLDKARELLPDLGGQPVMPDDVDLYVRLAAARGDYEEADRLLADALNYVWKDPAGRPMYFGERIQIGRAVASVLLGEAQHLMETPLFPMPPWLAPIPSEYLRRRWRLDAIEVGLGIGQQRAEWYLLRGWLALESGRCVEARGYFQDMLDTLPLPQHWIPEIQKLEVLSEDINPVEIQHLQELRVRQSVARIVSQQYLKRLEASQR